MRTLLAGILGIGLVTATLAGLAGALPPTAEPGAREAVAGFLARHGSAAEAPAALDALPPQVGASLARVVGAFEGLEVASAAAYAKADLGLAPAWAAGSLPLPGSLQAGWAAAGFDPTGILAARAALEDAGLALRAAVAAAPRGSLPPVHLQAAPALALDTAGVDDVYTQDTALTLDFGGDDLYLNNAGGSNLVGACVEIVLGPGVGAVMDLAGHDQYASGRGCGINGGGSLGVGFLLDAAGDDVYWADVDTANKGVNGGGSVLGLGFLRDLAGHDAYTSGGWGTNGGGWVLGAGLLVDDAGDDVYQASYDGVNGGGSLGAGMLLDRGGSDLYQESCQATCTTAWDETVAPKDFVGAQMDL